MIFNQGWLCNNSVLFLVDNFISEKKHIDSYQLIKMFPDFNKIETVAPFNDFAIVSFCY